MQKNIIKNKTKQVDFSYKFYKVIMPKIYGIGAAIVILGAMFKLLNWAGGGMMLGVGLTTEAIIFFLSAFEPQAKEVDWTKAYPELKEEGEEGVSTLQRRQKGVDVSLSNKLDELFEKAQIDAQLLDKLSSGMNALVASTNQIASLSNTLEVTQKFTINLEKTSDMLVHMCEAQSRFLQAMHNLYDLSDLTQAFNSTLKKITTTLDQANNAYNMDLKDIHTNLQATKVAYSGLADTVKQLEEVGAQTQVFKEEMTHLSSNLSSLNKVYGNMLTALKS